MLKKLLAAGLLVCAPFGAVAQSAERSVTLETTAKVLNVFPESRTVVLDNVSTGHTEFLKVGPEVINFDQIEIGDTVKAGFTVGLAARMAMAGEVDTVTELDAFAAEGEKPGAISGAAVTLVLEFLSFDAAASVATVRTSDGVKEMIEVVSDEGRDFASELSAGDMVALTFVEGVAVGIVEE